jgi:hypothetical protein
MRRCDSVQPALPRPPPQRAVRRHANPPSHQETAHRFSAPWEGKDAHDQRPVERRPAGCQRPTGSVSPDCPARIDPRRGASIAPAERGPPFRSSGLSENVTACPPIATASREPCARPPTTTAITHSSDPTPVRPRRFRQASLSRSPPRARVYLIASARRAAGSACGCARS